MTLIANGVGLPPDLASTLSQFGNNAYSNINNNYNAARKKAASDATAQGFAGGQPTDYVTQRLGATQGLDIGNLESGMGLGLGDTAYKDTIAQRNFNQQKQIADLIGNAAAPSLLQQIFSGIGGGTKAAGQLAPFMGMLGRSSGASGGGAYDIENPGALDMESPFTPNIYRPTYDYQSNWR